MNELIKIDSATIGGEEQKTVNARELHAFLEVGKDFSTWLKDRISKYDFVENVDFVKIDSPISGNQRGGDRRSIEYYISLPMAKELSMVERNAKGKEARLYFIECERIAKAKTTALVLPNFEDPAEAAMAWAEQYRKRKALECKVEEDAPKVSFAESVTASDSELTTTAAAKVLGIGPRKFFDWLRMNGFLYKQANQATQDSISAGLMVVRFASVQHSDGVEQKPYPHITGKGLYYFYRRLLDAGLIAHNETLELAA